MVTAWNRSAQSAAQLAKRFGMNLAATVDDVFAAANVVHSILADDSAVLEIFSDDLLKRVPAGRVHVNHATISPSVAAELAARHAQHGVAYVTAPVLGRSDIALTGTLLIVVSGTPTAIEVAMPSLGVLGQRIWNLGADPRSGSVVKIAVNYSIISALQSLAESVTLVETAGIDPSEFVEILTHTAFSGSAHRGYGPIIAEKRYKPAGFMLGLGLKDLNLAESLATGSWRDLAGRAVRHELFAGSPATPGLLRILDSAAVAEMTRLRSRANAVPRPRAHRGSSSCRNNSAQNSLQAYCLTVQRVCITVNVH